MGALYPIIGNFCCCIVSASYTKILQNKVTVEKRVEITFISYINKPLCGFRVCRRMQGLNPGHLRHWHWQSDALTTRLNLITRLDLIHTRLDLIHTRLGLIHYTRLDLIHYSARSHPPRLDLIHYSAKSHPHLALSHPLIG